jgi:uncharacterized membrane protein YuzA (DUF378 family)
MLIYALIGAGAVIALLLLGRMCIRALRAFVKNCWPQS